MPEAVPLITRLHERTDGTASQKKEKPSLAQFKQAHEPFARKQARRRAAAHAHACTHANASTHVHAHAQAHTCSCVPRLRETVGLTFGAHAVLLSAHRHCPVSAALAAPTSAPTARRARRPPRARPAAPGRRARCAVTSSTSPTPPGRRKGPRCERWRRSTSYCRSTASSERRSSGDRVGRPRTQYTKVVKRRR